MGCEMWDVGAAALGGPSHLDTPPHPGGVDSNELLKGHAVLSGSGARGTTGRLEEAAGQ